MVDQGLCYNGLLTILIINLYDGNPKPWFLGLLPIYWGFKTFTFHGFGVQGYYILFFVYYMSSLSPMVRLHPRHFGQPNSFFKFGWPKKNGLKSEVTAPKGEEKECFFIKTGCHQQYYYKYETLWISMGGNVTRSNLIKSVPCKSKAIKNKSPLELLIINPH